jgi:hypothetical protein
LDFVKEDWNFKGFGWAFYKSLIFLESFGMSLTIPITLNLNTWERRPGLPSISSSIDLYYPPTVAVFLSASLNLDYCKWALASLFQCVRYAIRTVVYILLGIVLPQQQQQDTVLSLEPPQYNLRVSERIGMSLSWRISRDKGYEFRVSYWHSQLPTLAYLHSLLFSARDGSKKRLTGTRTIWDNTQHWLYEKKGSLGISTTGPAPDPPHFSCSTFLSLSGFHYGTWRKKRGEKSSRVSTTAATTTTTSVRVSGDLEKVAR